MYDVGMDDVLRSKHSMFWHILTLLLYQWVCGVKMQDLMFDPNY